MAKRLNEKETSDLVQSLKQALSDTAGTYAMTHTFHWNVEGIHFQPLHAMFEEQYTEMWAAIDHIAERLRALNVYAPAFSELLNDSDVQTSRCHGAAGTMISELISAHEVVVKSWGSVVKDAQKADDSVTEDLAIQRLEIHQKTLWMLRSMEK